MHQHPAAWMKYYNKITKKSKFDNYRILYCNKYLNI